MADERAYEISTTDRLIAVINGGDDNADATKDYHNIMETLQNRVGNHGGKHKAKLVLTIEFEADHKGIDVVLTTEAKLPKRPKTKERYFDSGKGTLTLKDPARGSLFEGTDLGRAKHSA